MADGRYGHCDHSSCGLTKEQDVSDEEEDIKEEETDCFTVRNSSSIILFPILLSLNCFINVF